MPNGLARDSLTVAERRRLGMGGRLVRAGRLYSRTTPEVGMSARDRTRINVKTAIKQLPATRRMALLARHPGLTGVMEDRTWPTHAHVRAVAEACRIDTHLLIEGYTTHEIVEAVRQALENQ